MIVKSVGINGIPAESGIDKTRVIQQQNPFNFGEAKPHSAPRTSFLSGLASKARTLMIPLGLAAPLTLTGCDGLPQDIESSTYINTVTQPDGGATPTGVTSNSEYQIRPTDETVIKPEYGHKLKPTDKGKITPHYGPQIIPKTEPAIKPHILEEAGKAVEMLDEAGNPVKVSMKRVGEKFIAIVGTRLSHMG